MSLPAHFSQPQDYFTAAVDFLRNYAWIYQNANTCFIKADILTKFPKEFIDYFSNIDNDDLNTFPYVLENMFQLEEYTDLNNFRSKLKNLIPLKAYEEEIKECTQAKEKPHFHKMNIKKQHEIERLAQVIHRTCRSENNILIDFGVGLGYLSEMLYKLDDSQQMLILGLESEQNRIEAAQKRLQQNMPLAGNRIVYKKKFITEDSRDFIEESVSKLAALNGSVKAPNMAIIGLHACADLTITSIKLFLQMDSVKRLIIMPCCYHKLELAQTELLSFTNFPLSTCLKNVVAKNCVHSSEFFNRPFLRLACQQTTARWRDSTAAEHTKHGSEMFHRAVAEALLDETEMIVILKKQEIKDETEEQKGQQAFTFARCCEMFKVKSKITHDILNWQKQHETKFTKIMTEYGEERGVKIAEALTCLQTAMQKLCENIVLYDRLCYMQEFASKRGIRLNARYEKIFNEKLSPRCYVLIAEKL